MRMKRISMVLALPSFLLMACPEDGGSITGLSDDTDLSELSDDEYCDAVDSAIEYIEEEATPSQSEGCYFSGQIAGSLAAALDGDYEEECQDTYDACLDADAEEEEEDEEEDCEVPDNLDECDSTVAEVEDCLDWFAAGQRAFWDEIEEQACAEPGEPEDVDEDEDNPCEDVCDAFNPAG